MLQHTYLRSKIPSKVIVLGAGGFVGKKLIAALSDQNISCLSLSSKDINLTDVDSAQKLLKHIHPGDTLVVLSVQKPNKNMDVASLIANLKIANNICLAIQNIENLHVIYFSSDAVYSYDKEKIDETITPRPTNLYGIMHLTREMIFKEAVSKDALLIVRPTQIYGPSANHNAYGPCQLARSAWNENKINLFGKGEEKRDFIAVEDVVELTRLSILHRTIGLVNLATGHSVTYAELAGIIVKNIGKEVTVDTLIRKNEVTHRSFDIKLLNQAFDDFKFTNLEDNIKAFWVNKDKTEP